MGKINSGILGGFSGKIGNVVGAKWRGIDVMKIKPSNVRNPKTEGQVKQRSRFGLMIGFLKIQGEYINEGYRQFAKGMSPMNAAMSYNIQNALTGTYPNIDIDYPNVMLSRGVLTPAINGAATSSNAGVINLSWTDNSGSGSAKTNDQAMVVVFSPTLQESVIKLDGATRTDATLALTLPSAFEGETVKVYLAFKSSDGSKVSNSTYLGSITIAS